MIMAPRVKALICIVLALGVWSFVSTVSYPNQQWLHFLVYLAAVLLSSGMKIAMPNSEGTLSVNFPFILLGILQLSPLQAVALAACSVVAQCRFRVLKPFTLVQILFNVANVTTATVLAWHSYAYLTRLHLETAPALAIAATIYFLTNSIPVTLIIASDQGISPLAQWRRDFLWYVPFYLVGAALAAVASFIDASFGWWTSLLLVPLIYTIYRAYSAQMATVRAREQHALDTEALHLRTIEGLAMAIEAKDRNTHRHLLRVRVYVSEIGKILGLDQPQMQALLTAAFLHDIGKLAVPEHIINKPGRLTHEEFEKMKIHPVVGADILERVRFPYPVVPIVRSHHESWDGSGYPDGLKGEAIPIGARILTVVDCFDALASERPYRKPLPIEEAMAIVKSRSGIQFDPKIVDLLEEHYPQLEEKASRRIGEIEPLKTDLLIHRGAAPGAGLEPDFDQLGRVSRGQESVNQRDVAQYFPELDTNPSLDLIAAAGEEAKGIFELSQMLGSSLSARETILNMCRRIKPLIPNSCFAVYLRAGSSLIPHFVDGEFSKAFANRKIPLGQGVSGWVANSARPMLNGNPTVEPNYLQECGLFSSTGSALSIPLIDLSGSTFGVLTVYSPEPTAFSKDHLRILLAIEAKFSLSLQNALRFRIAESEAKIDHLTQLLNMRQFMEQVDAEIKKSSRTDQRFGVAVCDLNAFKAVNDRYGHFIGNQMLRMISDGFRECCRPQDTIGRMGGDEFVFLLPALDIESASRHIRVVEHAVQQARINLRITVGVTASVGIAFYPEDGESAEELLVAADRRMYLQKQTYYEIAQTTDNLPDFESSAV
jgi:diguanylate cyclase (GGDEF)-like protein/putative nucleotidyltransferase with HDIG domain